MSKKWRGVRKSVRKRVMAKTDGHCFYCGAPADTIDHIESRAYLRARGIHQFTRQGAKHIPNLLPACVDCNGYKGPLTLEQFRTKLSEITLRPYFIFWGETRSNPCPHLDLDKKNVSTPSLLNTSKAFISNLLSKPLVLGRPY